MLMALVYRGTQRQTNTYLRFEYEFDTAYAIARQKKRAFYVTFNDRDVRFSTTKTCVPLPKGWVVVSKPRRFEIKPHHTVGRRVKFLEVATGKIRQIVWPVGNGAYSFDYS
jgi:hypothetical protein